LGADGNFYGTTLLGGNASYDGTVFRITPEGALTTLYTFCSQSNCADGANPGATVIQATDGNFYGTLESGGAYGGGTVFKITPKGALTTLYSSCSQGGANCTDGHLPAAPLVQAANGNFYGTTAGGGVYSFYSGGTVFEITPAGAFTSLYSFCAQANCADGSNPQQGGLMQGTDGNFYGTTYGGGTNGSCAGCGTVFKVTPGGTLFTLHDFDGTDGEFIFEGLVQGTNGSFFGPSNQGGPSNACSGGCGTVFGLSVGLGPFVEALPISGKVGETIQILGTNLTDAACVRFNGTPAAFTVHSETLISAIVPTGATTGFVTVTTPTGTLMRNEKHKTIHGVRLSATLTSRWRRRIGLLCVVLTAVIVSPAQEQPSPATVKFKTLVNFDGTNGWSVYAGLAQGTDGNLYGTTEFGGTNNPSECSTLACGTVYKMTPGGTLTTIHSFCAEPNCADGWLPSPDGALALGTDGSFYGVTNVGGASASSGPCAPSGGCGTIFKITPSGAWTPLYNQCSQANCADSNGSNYSGVVRGADGNLYGTMPVAGATSGPLCASGYPGAGCGTIFKITPEGAFTTIYNFCSQSNCTDGGSPFTGLVSGTDGNLYGMTSVGGANGAGTIFKMTLNGKLTTLHSFGSADGNCGGFICSPMIQASNGNFYGVTLGGGANGAGTFFEITPAGAFTTLYNFCSKTNCADGNNPFGLVQASDGNFYGATEIGGTDGDGTLFEVTPEGALTTLHNFDGTNGANPQNLAQATNGTFYGTTSSGGNSNDGTVFAVSAGLGPFVETLPTSGKVGDTIQILGTNLTGATSVSFNGTPASFTVDSKTLISATVPTGATTGLVTVTLPTGTLKSNVRFQVRP
jgi:uncharacterized repeat protein (TIGR03803 family)